MRAQAGVTPILSAVAPKARVWLGKPWAGAPPPARRQTSEQGCRARVQESARRRIRPARSSPVSSGAMQMRFLSFRRAVVLAAVAAGLLAAPTAQAASTYTPVRGTDFFAPSGVWNQPLAGNARLANNSRALVATLNANFPAYVPYINTASYSTPIYTVPAA